MECDTGRETKRKKKRARKEGRKERQTRQGRSKECFAWKESGRGWVAERKGGCGGCLRAATGVCPMLSVVAMGILLIGRRADRRHGSRGATPTIARPRAPPTARQRPLLPPPFHVSIPRAFTSPLSHATPIPVFDPMAAQTRPNTLDTRPSSRVLQRLPPNPNFRPSLPFNAIDHGSSRNQLIAAIVCTRIGGVPPPPPFRKKVSAERRLSTRDTNVRETFERVVSPPREIIRGLARGGG